MDAAPGSNGSRDSRKRAIALGAAALLLVTLAVFADVLIFDRNAIAGQADLDVWRYFAPIRAFGFEHIANGHLPQWNPHLYSGTPYAANFQSALFYPPNLIYVLLPLGTAINVDLAIHVALFALLFFCWTLALGLRPLGAAYGAIILALSGAYHLHVTAGHLTFVAAMAWTPAIFLCIHRLHRSPDVRWAVCGGLATTLHVLAGYPNAVLYTAIICVIYSLCLLPSSVKKMRYLGLLVLFAAIPLLATAVQLWPAVAMAAETERSGQITYQYATANSLPPESVITLVAPSFFGDNLAVPYWGRLTHHATVIYVGVIGLLMAILGVTAGHHKTRWIYLALAMVAAAITLGKNAPFYHWLYEYIPLFDQIRNPMHASTHATLFLCVLAGMGADRLVDRQSRVRWMSGVSAALAAVVLGGALWIYASGATTEHDEPWPLISRIMNTGESLTWAKDIAHDIAAATAVQSLLIGGAIALVASALIALSTKSHRLRFLIIAIGVAEVVGFVFINRPSFPVERLHDPAWEAAVKDMPEDARILHLDYRNDAMYANIQSAWGYDPLLLQRYAEFISYTQKGRIDLPRVGDFSNIPARYHRRMQLVRVGRVMKPVKTPDEQLLNDRIPRFFLVHAYSVARNRELVYEFIDDPAFDPRQTAILEQEIGFPMGRPADSDRVFVVDESTDHVTLKVDLAEPGILVISDAYSAAWRASPANDSDQDTYDLMPANGILRAVPLSAGHHHIRIEYTPWQYRAGMASSIATLTLCLLAGLVTARRRWRRRSKGLRPAGLPVEAIE